MPQTINGMEYYTPYDLEIQKIDTIYNEDRDRFDKLKIRSIYALRNDESLTNQQYILQEYLRINGQENDYDSHPKIKIESNFNNHEYNQKEFRKKIEEIIG